jgi:hypothetical protein
MAVRGAVAEKHLAKIVEDLHNRRKIDSYRTASGDMDKDFYLALGGKEFSLECKNVEVIKTTAIQKKINYITFLAEKEYIPFELIEKIIGHTYTQDLDLKQFTGTKINELFNEIPQKYRESGLVKYQFSSSQLESQILGQVSDEEFLSQFETTPITIDFQRTRNSTDENGDTKRNRYYRIGEIDIIGACLFSRTMEWKFMYAKSESLEIHAKYPDRYSNKLTLRPGAWTSNLEDLISTK